MPGDESFFSLSRSLARGLSRRISGLRFSYQACICDSKAKFVHRIISFLFLDFPVP